MYIPYVAGSATCCAMKHPNPDRLVVTEGMPITVHSAVRVVCEGVCVSVRERERECVSYVSVCACVCVSVSYIEESLRPGATEAELAGPNHSHTEQDRALCSREGSTN